MTRKRPTARRLAAAAMMVTLVAAAAWLARARPGARDPAAAESPAPARAAPIRGSSAATEREAAPAVARRNPIPAASLPPAERFVVSGRVVERLPAGGYTYLRVRPDGGDADVWLAMLAGSAPPGDEVEAVAMGKTANFHSRRLGRSFDLLLFASAVPTPATPSHRTAPPAKGTQP
jgi:hypothetical protein